MMSFGQFPSYVPSNGLVGWWPFDGGALDMSSNGNNGSVNSNAILTTDRYGNPNSAYYFDGTDNSDIDIPTSTNLNITNDITISFWIFPNSNNGEKHIIDRDLCGFDNDWRILQLNNFIHWSTGVSGSDQYVSVSLIPNQWNFVVAKRDGNLFTLSINDSFSSPSQMTLNNSSFVNNSLPIYFGDAVCNSSSQNNFLGKLDDIGIWNRALNQQEIIELYYSCIPTSSTDVITTCDSYTWIDGNTYTTSNNSATFTTTNAAGCDSVITLDLTINNSSTSTDVITACDSYTWLDGNTYTTSNNTATYTTTNATGCDSIITLDLTINSVIEPLIIQNGSTLACTNFASGYQWLDCDANYNPITGETGMTFVATQTGNYALEINLNNCIDTSDCFLIDLAEIGKLNNTTKQLIKIVDVLGRETPFKPNTPLLYIYNDGTVERKMIIKE